MKARFCWRCGPCPLEDSRGSGRRVCTAHGGCPLLVRFGSPTTTAGAQWQQDDSPGQQERTGVTTHGSTRTPFCKQKGGKRPPQQPAQRQHANYWAPLMCKRHILPHPAQPQHSNHWAPRTRQRPQQEHRPQRPTESGNPTQHAKERTGDCPGPRKETPTQQRQRCPISRPAHIAPPLPHCVAVPRELFDLSIVFAKKPTFFHAVQPFLKVDLRDAEVCPMRLLAGCGLQCKCVGGLRGGCFVEYLSHGPEKAGFQLGGRGGGWGIKKPVAEGEAGFPTPGRGGR